MTKIALKIVCSGCAFHCLVSGAAAAAGCGGVCLFSCSWCLVVFGDGGAVFCRSRRCCATHNAEIVGMGCDLISWC